MGSSKDYTRSAINHNNRGSFEGVYLGATHYNSGSSGSSGDEQQNSPGGYPPVVSDSDRTVSRRKSDPQTAAARICTQRPLLNFPHHASYALGLGAPVLQHPSMQAPHQFPQAVPAQAHAQQYPAHAHAQQYPAHAHAHAQQYPTHAHAQQYPVAPQKRVLSLEEFALYRAQAAPQQYRAQAAPQQQKGVLSLEEFAFYRAQSMAATSTPPSRTPASFPNPTGRPMPSEISAAYEVLARAELNPLPIPQAAQARPVQPHLAMPPGAQLVNPMSNYHQHQQHQQLSAHMLAPAPAPISYPHAFPPNSHLAGNGPFPPPQAPLASSYPGTAASRPLLESQMQKDEASDERSSDEESEDSKPKKMPRKQRRIQDPVYAILSKQTMMELMEKYGPVTWYSGAKQPYLDWQKERTLFALRQIFFRWNPNFSDDFRYSTEKDDWVPIRGEQAEIKRRVKLRSMCNKETAGIRARMYARRRQGPRTWKTQKPRHYCYKMANKRQKEEDVQNSDDQASKDSEKV